MRLAEYVPVALAEALLDADGVDSDNDGVFRGRASRRRPGQRGAIIWRIDESTFEHTIDGSAGPLNQSVVIECRHRLAEVAANIADQVLCEMRPHAIAIEDQYDESDDPSQQRGDYFSSIVRVVLPPDNLPHAP